MECHGARRAGAGSGRRNLSPCWPGAPPSTWVMTPRRCKWSFTSYSQITPTFRS